MITLHEEREDSQQSTVRKTHSIKNSGALSNGFSGFQAIYEFAKSNNKDWLDLGLGSAVHVAYRSYIAKNDPQNLGLKVAANYVLNDVSGFKPIMFMYSRSLTLGYEDAITLRTCFSTGFLGVSSKNHIDLLTRYSENLRILEMGSPLERLLSGENLTESDVNLAYSFGLDETFFPMLKCSPYFRSWKINVHPYIYVDGVGRVGIEDVRELVGTFEDGLPTPNSVLEKLLSDEDLIPVLRYWVSQDLGNLGRRIATGGTLNNVTLSTFDGFRCIKDGTADVKDILFLSSLGFAEVGKAIFESGEGLIGDVNKETYESIGLDRLSKRVKDENATEGDNEVLLALGYRPRPNIGVSSLRPNIPTVSTAATTIGEGTVPGTEEDETIDDGGPANQPDEESSPGKYMWWIIGGVLFVVVLVVVGVVVSVAVKGPAERARKLNVTGDIIALSSSKGLISNQG